MFLPLPVIILQDGLELWRRIFCFVLPALVQGIVGNGLEPWLFGKSLNQTAISILCGLVFWGWIWGIPGAIMSVPLLAGQKILLTACDYPLAKRVLFLMKEDNSIEDTVAGIGRRKKTDGTNDTSSIKAGLVPPPRPYSGGADVEKPRSSPYGPIPTVSTSTPSMQPSADTHMATPDSFWNSTGLRQLQRTHGSNTRSSRLLLRIARILWRIPT
eukprot:SAG31_NODE_9655_length_1245_cov_1.617801_1_plen_214_part_00